MYARTGGMELRTCCDTNSSFQSPTIY